MKGKILTEAQELINGDRNESYGEFSENVDNLTQLMEAMTGRSYSKFEGCCFFLALKLCRNDGEKFTHDTLADLAGYTGLIADVMSEETEVDESPECGNCYHLRYGENAEACYTCYGFSNWKKEVQNEPVCQCEHCEQAEQQDPSNKPSCTNCHFNDPEQPTKCFSTKGRCTTPAYENWEKK